MASHYEEMAAATRAALVDAFWTLYSEKKIEEISIKEITALAHCHRATFYRHFTDIYDLLEQIETELLDPLQELADERMVDQDRRYDLYRAVADVYEQNAKYFSLLLTKDYVFAERMKDTLRPHMMEALGLDPQNPMDRYAVEFGMAATIGSITYWYQSGKDISSEELIAFIGDGLTCGVLQPAGGQQHAA